MKNKIIENIHNYMSENDILRDYETYEQMSVIDRYVELKCLEDTIKKEYYTSFLASIAICGFICLCFFILRRAELYFGLNLVNLIKMNKLEAIYIGKYYRKKISQMIRAIRGIVKFKKIHKEMNNGNNKENDEYENLVDIKMKKVVQHYEIKKKKKIK